MPPTLLLISAALLCYILTCQFAKAHSTVFGTILVLQKKILHAKPFFILKSIHGQFLVSDSIELVDDGAFSLSIMTKTHPFNFLDGWILK